jgi:hypothetical protein
MSDRKLLLNITSDNRLSGTSSQFTVGFNESELNNVSSIKFKNIILHNTIGNIHQYNNKFHYSDGITDLFVEIPLGNYTITELLNAITLGLSLETVPITAAFSVNSLTNRIECTSCVPAIEFFDYKGIVDNELGRNLGLAGNSGLVTSLVFTNIIDLTGIDAIAIYSKALSNYSNIEMQRIRSIESRISSIRSSCVKVLPVDSSFGYKINYTSPVATPDVIFKDLQNKSLHVIDISLRDFKNRKLDLQGTTVYISLEIQFEQS